MVFPIAALFAVVKVACVVCGAAFCTHKVTEAYKKGQKTRGLKYKDKEAARQAAAEANKLVQPKLDEKQNEYKNQEQENKNLEKEIEDVRNKSNDPNLNKEEQDYWRGKFIELEEKLNQGKNKSKTLFKEAKDLESQIKSNNKTINSPSLSYDSDKSWIWEVLTLENILIMLAIYALYNIVRDERKWLSSLKLLYKF